MNPLKTMLALASSVLVLSTSAPAALVAGYKLDELFGDLAVDSIRGDDGTGTLANFSGLQWVSGKIGAALEFDGANDFVLAPNALRTGTTAFTISMWAWADTNRSWGSLVKNWGDVDPGAFHFGLDAGSGQLSNYLGTPQDGPIIAPTTFGLQAWHHVAVTWNGATQNEVLYVDGVAVATHFTAVLTSLTERGPNMAFGVKPNNSTFGPSTDCCPGYWDGKMDDIAFFDTALTADEILKIKIDGDNGVSAIIPEPGSALLAVAGALGLGLRRRR